ncbi:MAG: hypothetical protein E6G60_12635 [Actinobacteria bacterium]|jgi:hypothetical protein|nr:MAG: hypothetical protein E6G60_12635 [Actinomycetota bacterium]
MLGIMQSVTAKYGKRYINGASVLEDSTTTYVMYLPCQPADYTAGDCFMGVALLRTDDHVHLRDSGQRRYAEHIVAGT